MSLNRDTHSSSTLSASSSETSSRSSSTDRRSLPTTARTPTDRTARRNVKSAPAAFTSVPNTSQATNLTSNPSPTDPNASASTLVNPLPTSEEKATLRDAYEKAGFQPEHNHHQDTEDARAIQPEQVKAKRTCASNLEFDWTYSNVYTSGSRHGRKTIGNGSGAPGACSLM